MENPRAADAIHLPCSGFREVVYMLQYLGEHVLSSVILGMLGQALF